MAHYIPSMMALAPKTQELFDRLPSEFTKKQYEAIRNELAESRYPYCSAMSLTSAREYGIVKVVRTEKTTYTKERLVYVNPKTEEQFTEEQLTDVWCRKLAREFGVQFDGGNPPVWRMKTDYAEVECEGFRNIFGINWNKFHAMTEDKGKI